MYCRDNNHKLSQCTLCPNHYSLRTAPKSCSASLPLMVSHSPFTSHPPFTIKTQILCSDQIHCLSALIDSGFAGYFIDHRTATQYPVAQTQQTPKISAIDGGPIGEGVDHFCTETITLRTSCLHLESISFLVTNTPNNPIILGISWLQQHDLIISWTQREIVKWSRYCSEHCLHLP